LPTRTGVLDNESRTDFGKPYTAARAHPKGIVQRIVIFLPSAYWILKIDADSESSTALIGFNLHFHTLAKTSITAIYER
jgi:hypothetical protein